MQITTAVETITPERANQLLATLSERQRDRRKGHVNYLRAEIEHGYWKLTGDTIKIDANGKVIDGQHRLAAVVATNKPIESVVVFGIDPDAYDAIDTGKRRNAADVLQMRGETNYSLLASAIGVAISLEEGGRQIMKRSRSPIAIEAYLDRNRRIRESVSMAGAHYTRLLHPSLAAALHYCYLKRGADQERMDLFLSGMDEGFNPIRAHNFHMFREVLIKNATALAKLRRNILAAYALLAINATLQREKLQRFDWTPRDIFPSILVPKP